MIFDHQLPELKLFRESEQRIAIDGNPSFASLVIASDIDDAPIHRWFRFKESYSPLLLPAVLELIRPKLGKTFSLLDPFCGMGTSLVSAQLLTNQGYTIEGTGIEQNPFARWAAEVKLAWPRVDVRLITKLSKSAHAVAKSSLPALSSISKGKCISRHMAGRVLGTREALLRHRPSETREAMLLGLAAAIEPVSKTRKDGRALRIVDKPRFRFETVISARWDEVSSDVRTMKTRTAGIRFPAQKVISGDGRDPIGEGIERNSIDLVLTSPPYPNNIDYSEVYKLELWLLGFIDDPESFLNLRKSTFRSHPTCDLSPPSDEYLRSCGSEDWGKIVALLAERAEKAGEKWRSRMIMGYFADLRKALRGIMNVLKPGGFAIIVIGNSLHGTRENPCLIPTDLVLSLMGQSLGFELDKLVIARPLKRRLSGNHFLRESVVVLRKPHVI